MPRTRASWWPRSLPARSSWWCTVRRARSRSASTSTARAARPLPGRPGPAGPGRCRARAARGPARRTTSCRARSRRWSMRGVSSATSGTTSLAASVGVEARTSATRSSSGLSGSWPIAETTGVRAAKTARSSPSSENGSRSSTEPPPRAITITSTSGSRSSRPSWSDHLGGRAGALHRGVPDREPDRRPPAPGVLEHVALGGAVGGGHQADRPGQERQPALALGGEQALRREQLATALDAGEQLAEPDHPDLAGVERQRAAVGVERRLGVHDDGGALDHRRVERVEDLARAGHRDGDVGHRVAQGEEDGVHALPPVELGDLALDPDGAQPVDPLGDGVGDLPDRCRLLEGGLQGHGPDPRGRHLRWGA